MKKALMLSLFLVLLGVRSEAQVCGRVNGTLAAPTITVSPGCAGGAIVSRGDSTLLEKVEEAEKLLRELKRALG